MTTLAHDDLTETDDTPETAVNHFNKFFTEDSNSFMTLPAELRMKVYNFLMNDDATPISGTQRVLCSSSSQPDFGWINRAWGKMLEIENSEITQEALSSQLLRSCKLIYEEVMPILYQNRQVIIYSFCSLPSLTQIGKRGQSFVRSLILCQYLCKLPPFMKPRNKSDLCRIGLLDDRKRRPSPLPQLPNLDRIEVCHLVDQSVAALNRGHVEVECFGQNLIDSKASRGHYLHKYMTLMRRYGNAEWRTSLLSYTWSTPYSRTKMLEVRCGRFCIEVISSPDDKKGEGRWRIRDTAEGGGAETITFWRKDL